MIAGKTFESSISTDRQERFYPDIFDFLLHKSTMALWEVQAYLNEIILYRDFTRLKQTRLKLIP